MTGYYRGILNGPIDAAERISAAYPVVEATTGLMVMHRGSRFRGTIERIEHDGAVVLRSPNSGTERVFTMSPGAFALQGETVTLVRPATRPTANARTSTASGSLALSGHKARVARAARIFVEGLHDAELVEKVWGDDLRVEGVVVERLDGIDNLQSIVTELSPRSNARLGVLVDHLVAGSKEARIAKRIETPHVLVTGTPYVDVWQAIRPSTIGIEAWPIIPIGQSWKAGICDIFGEPDATVLWRRLLNSVETYADLEPSFVGAVESLIDFVTTGDDPSDFVKM